MWNELLADFTVSYILIFLTILVLLDSEFVFICHLTKTK